MELTAENVRDVFNYYPDTGTLKRKTLSGGENATGSYCNSYLRVSYKKHEYYAHRVAWLWMTGAWPAYEIDHINHKKDDNRWSNLREVTHRENHQNIKRVSDNTSGVTGVQWDKKRGKWTARIHVEGSYVGLYYGDDFFLAVAMRKSADARYGFHANHGRAA